MTGADILSWRGNAKPGDKITYYRGFLAMTGEYLLKEAVAAAYLSGWFDLTQRRHGPRDYEYIITRRAQRDPRFRTWTLEAEKGGRDALYQKPTIQISALGEAAL